jgi:hypothetical protein
LIAGLLAALMVEQRAETGPWINTTSYSVPIYRVSASTPTVSVRLEGASDPALAAAWRAVPLPPGARPAAGNDHELVVWQPARDRLWEFWRLHRDGRGWSAAWGGAMRNVSGAPGVFGKASWPGARPWWGMSASSLSLPGGLITPAELAAGQIDHALALAVPEVRAGVFALPAQRTDGTSKSPAALPEGARLQLNPRLDLAALHLPPTTLMIARAAQRYGIYITDRAPEVTFFAEDPSRGDPYGGRSGYFEGEPPSRMLARFPWKDLEVLRLKLRASRCGRSARRGQEPRLGRCA